MKIKIGGCLKKLRMEKGLTQKGLAAAVRGGLDYTYIGKIERGEQLPSLKVLIKLSEALCVPLGSFFPEKPGSMVHDISTKAAYSITDEQMTMLYEAIETLHGDDIPLLLEIIKALNRHRTGKKTDRPND
ncbi:MAG TPA: helix-turn-helix domain-containing protein [Geobacteraceae bacterium]|nr:helix-turn-helix domain-containing protein [Geobacteraceae bacterium]